MKSICRDCATANVAVGRLALHRTAEIGSDRNAIILSAEAHTLGHREQLEKFRRICNRVGGEARMQVLQHFDVAAPAIEGQVSGAH